ncbi:MAG: HesA/MoeB/ThiF family protein [Candidatus Aenigmarchaeota archaeon]|nr:HesA/MoeB/ThiF family protein [Candidatus Aenigmarchaeota archaeon]
MMPSNRFSRQIATGLVSPEEQKALAKKTAAIVGLGGLGSVSAELILRCGVRKLILIDRDVVEQSNLSRQLYFEGDTGTAKAEALKTKLLKIDSKAKISAHAISLDASNANVLKKADIILDGTDNMDARFLINEFALKNKIPWVYAAATGSVGATMNIVPEGPCFSCVFGTDTSPEACGVLGVINSATVAITSFQVVEALKILLGKRDVNRDLMYVDVWSGEMKKIRVMRRSSCGVCGEN